MIESLKLSDILFFISWHFLAILTEKKICREMHRGFKDQLTGCQRQFRAANLNQMNQLERMSHKELMSGAELR